MFKPLALFLGLRYTRAKKKNHFVSFISLTSIIGIGLGVMVLITVLSVMNGFDEEIHKRFFGMAPEVTINAANGKMQDWQTLMEKVGKYPGVKAVAPFVGGQGLLTNQGQVQPIVLTGILPEKEAAITHLSEKLLIGNMDALQHFGIVLGRGFADNLGLLPEDKVTIMIPEAAVTPAGMVPRFKRFTVAGIFSAGSGFSFDTKLAFVHLEDAQKLFHLGHAVSGLKLKIDNIYQAPQISDGLAQMLGEGYQVGNWTDQFGEFFKTVKLEKTMMFFILMLIIIVAAFNLVSSLVMVVNDKQSEIAILRTIGATPGKILMIFIIQGMLLGFLGTFVGLILGLLLAYNATEIVNWLQNLFHVQVLSSNIHFVDFLPSKIMLSDVLVVAITAMMMSFVATIYPAWRASRTVIAEALHYE